MTTQLKAPMSNISVTPNIPSGNFFPIILDGILYNSPEEAAQLLKLPLHIITARWSLQQERIRKEARRS